jgi:hypothetical protein
MQSIPHSGFYLSSQYARIILAGYAEVLGSHALDALLQSANLTQLNLAPSADDLERAVDFADFSAFHAALDESYGAAGSGLAIRAGRAAFPDLLDAFGSLLGVDQAAFKMLPLPQRLRTGLSNTAAACNRLSAEETAVREGEDAFVVTVHRCPICWGRQSTGRSLCHLTVGLLREGVSWLSGGLQWQVRETRCHALGDPACEFVLSKLAE